MENEFIKNYEKIRPVLRDIFVYGCFHREDFKERHVSLKKYDNEKRKALTFLNLNYIKEEIKNRRKYVRMMYNMFHVTENYLKDSYAIKKLGKNDAPLYIKIMQILSLKPGLAAENVETELLNYFGSEETNKRMCQDDSSRSTVYRKLNKLCEMGLLTSERQGKVLLYSIVEDPFRLLTNNELIELYNAVQYFANVLPLSMPGYSLQYLMKLYAENERNIIMSTDTTFMFKEHYIQQILDDEVVCFLIKAIKNNTVIDFEYCQFQGKWDKRSFILPVKIIVDNFYGRRYLFGINYTDLKTVRLFRVDRMRSLKGTEKCDNTINLHSAYEESMAYSWCSCPQNGDLVLVELIFHLNEDNVKFILGRIRKEGKWGKCDKIGEYLYRYSINVADPIEMKPWIRSFTGYIEVVGSSQHTLKEDLQAEWRELKRYYDNI